MWPGDCGAGKGAMTMRSAKCSRNFSGGYVEASRKWKEP